MKVKSLSHVRLFATPWAVAYQASLSMDFSGNSTGVDCHFFLQGIFLTQRSNPGLLHCRLMLYRMSNQGIPQRAMKVKVKVKSFLTLCDPMGCSLPGSSIRGIFQARVLEWTAISFSRESSWPTVRTQVSHIAGRYFTIWATRDALNCLWKCLILFPLKRGEKALIEEADLDINTCTVKQMCTPHLHTHP